MRFDPARRTLAPERMDHERITPEDLARCLRDLRRLNRLTNGVRPILRWIDRHLAARPRGERVEILDLACGGGDLLRAIGIRAARRGHRVRLRGLDLNPGMLAIARARCAGLDATFETGDALAWDGGADLVVSSLFLHHLEDARAAALLARVRAGARLGWLVADLHRHAIPFHGLRLGTALLGLHRFVRHDGPVSVARGWRAAELRALAREAGIPPDRFALRWRFPFRWLLSGQP